MQNSQTPTAYDTLGSHFPNVVKNAHVALLYQEGEGEGLSDLEEEMVGEGGEMGDSGEGTKKKLARLEQEVYERGAFRSLK